MYGLGFKALGVFRVLIRAPESTASSSEPPQVYVMPEGVGRSSVALRCQAFIDGLGVRV